MNFSLLNFNTLKSQLNPLNSIQECLVFSRSYWNSNLVTCEPTLYVLKWVLEIKPTIKPYKIDNYFVWISSILEPRRELEVICGTAGWMSKTRILAKQLQRCTLQETWKLKRVGIRNIQNLNFHFWISDSKLDSE